MSDCDEDDLDYMTEWMEKLATKTLKDIRSKECELVICIRMVFPDWVLHVSLEL